MGAEETATRRLNLAQAFNPMGALLGMYVAMEFIQRRLHPLDTAGRALLSGSEFEAVRDADLETLIAPYLVVGLVTLSMLVLVRLVRMPRHRDTSGKIDFLPTLKRLVAVRRYREGVVAQFFYVGAQIMCWTFIIQYGTRLFMSMGMAEQAAEVRSQQFNIAAMAVFCVSRFICTFLLRFFNSGLLLRTLAVLLHCLPWASCSCKTFGVCIASWACRLACRSCSPPYTVSPCRVWAKMPSSGPPG